MTKQKLFLVRATSGREATMKLPVDKHGGVTTKGHKMISDRFYDGATNTRHGMQYALCLEDFTNAKDLMSALSDYQKNIL